VSDASVVSREAMFEPGEPRTLDELAHALRALTTQGRGFLEALPVEAFFAPQGAKWSPAEHARHLRRSSAPLVPALRLPGFLLRALFGPSRRGSRTYARLRADYRDVLAAGGQAGRFAPSPEAAPREPEARRRAILDAWQRTNAALAGGVLSWDEARADRVRLPHPLLGPLTLREMAAFSVYHSAHHLELVRQRVPFGL